MTAMPPPRGRCPHKPGFISGTLLSKILQLSILLLFWIPRCAFAFGGREDVY